MLDHKGLDRLVGIAVQNSKNAELYRKARRKAADCKYALDILIAKAYLDGDIPKSVGYEKAQLMVAFKTVEHKQTYKELNEAIADFKGLEKVLEANSSQITLGQSMMKI